MEGWLLTRATCPPLGERTSIWTRGIPNCSAEQPTRTRQQKSRRHQLVRLTGTTVHRPVPDIAATSWLSTGGHVLYSFCPMTPSWFPAAGWVDLSWLRGSRPSTGRTRPGVEYTKENK